MDLKLVEYVECEFRPYHLIVLAAMQGDLWRIDVVQIDLMNVGVLQVDVVEIVLFLLQQAEDQDQLFAFRAHNFMLSYPLYMPG